MNFILHFLRCKYEMNYKKWPSHSQWIGMYKQSLNNVFITKKLRQKQLKEAHQVNTESCPRARAYYQARQRPPLLQQPCKTSTAWQGLTQYNRPHGLGKETAPQSQPEGGKQSERLLKPLHIPWPLLRSGSFLQASPAVYSDFSFPLLLSFYLADFSCLASHREDVSIAPLALPALTYLMVSSCHRQEWLRQCPLTTRPIVTFRDIPAVNTTPISFCPWHD